MPGEFEEAQLKAEAERKVRAEMLTEEERAQQIDDARRALWVAKTVLMLGTLAVGIPLVGAALGIGVRVFRFLSGV